MPAAAARDDSPALLRLARIRPFRRSFAVPSAKGNYALKLGPCSEPGDSRYGKLDGRLFSRYCLFSGLRQSFGAEPGRMPPQAKQPTQRPRATGYFLGEKLKNAKCNSPLPNIWIC